MEGDEIDDLFAGLGDETSDLSISSGQALPSGVFKHGQPGKADLLIEFAQHSGAEDIKKTADELSAGLAQYMAKIGQTNAALVVQVRVRFS
ncbi:MAG TPA: hypothetical protein PL070_05545 [Flavobacteriales bacterium]|nr:hypothetical protein [Flavobacteriales bacterium]